ncbi:hypothetical protein Y1Q_0016194 [Alligator mississippiensis]|uniref:Uncharacterized protein n=1 Tax=Alligator mississippiensis TaxID=8496 RepID=A0A151P136_ALLMI|nr:hypothetical protein Y1Q_0016194 [Alligator mississippiensis]
MWLPLPAETQLAFALLKLVTSFSLHYIGHLFGMGKLLEHLIYASVYPIIDRSCLGRRLALDTEGKQWNRTAVSLSGPSKDRKAALEALRMAFHKAWYFLHCFSTCTLLTCLAPSPRGIAMLMTWLLPNQASNGKSLNPL